MGRDLSRSKGSHLWGIQGSHLWGKPATAYVFAYVDVSPSPKVASYGVFRRALSDVIIICSCFASVKVPIYGASL